jgi:hypothetical protein
LTSEHQRALEFGYRLDQIYEFWHFPESSHDLFDSYINTSLKLKQEASGFPDDCQTPEQQQQYIQDILQRECILMNPSDIQKNPIWRIIAKLFLNCLFGKFVQRLQLPKSEYLTEKEITTCHVRNKRNLFFGEQRTS